jgi:Ca2+-transporting ATPase
MPEKVLGECSTYVLADGSTDAIIEEDRAEALKQSRRMAGSGLRVIALAYGQELGSLTFCGLIGMEDPPREGVADSVRHLRRGGVKVMMITGDSKETALAIAQHCGILGTDEDESTSGLNDLLLESSHEDRSLSDMEAGASEALSGTDIDSISPKDLAGSIAGVKVFYRVSPRHKLAIVRARKFDELGSSAFHAQPQLTLLFLFS